MPNIRPLSRELALKAQRELNEVPERIQNDLDTIKAWLVKQPHIKARTDDQFLITFLRGCKYSIERVKEKLDMYYTLRTALPELTRNRDPFGQRTIEIIRMGITIFLPLTDGLDGPRIMLFRSGAYDPDKFSIQEIMKVNLLFNDISFFHDDNLTIAGQVAIIDCENVSMAHFLQMSPTLMKKMTMLGQEGNPLRQKGLHYINTPPTFEKLFNLFKNFMSEKNQLRLYVHGNNWEALYQHVPKRLLPSEYGGEAGSIESIINYWEKKVQDHAQFLIDEDNYGTNEKLRPGKPKNSETLFGVEGSFRKLNVD